MLTFLFHVTIKAGREEEWRTLATRLTTAARTEDDGCLTYTFFQQADQPRAYVLFEQWRDGTALRGHVARLQRELGPPAPGSQLPAAFLDFFAESKLIRYEVLA